MKIYSKFMLVCLAAGVVLATSNNNMVSVNVNAEGTTVVSVKDAVNKLINSKNYTIEVSTKTGPIDIKYDIFYTENAFYDSYLGDEYGYVNVEEGVFSFDLYNREFTASKLLEDKNGNVITDLWSYSSLYSFNKLKIDEFSKANGKEFDAETKRVKNFFLNLFQLDYGYYQYVNPVHFTVGNDINTLEFVLEIQGFTTYTGKIKNFGTTKIDVVDEYLNNGNSYHKADTTMNKIVSLFDNYNYTRLIYSDEVEDYSIVAGTEMYAENWFYTFFEDEYISAGLGYEIGMVGIDKTYGPYTDDKGNVYGPYDFEGSYYCFVMEDENGNQTLDVMVSMPINTDPFVPNVYNYPTFLEMFTNSQYLQPTGGSANEYYTSKLSCVNDFVSNFQMTETLQSLGAVATGVYVEYLPTGSDYYAGTTGKECVVFKLEVSYYGALTTIDYVYTDFNTTNVECITQENVDAVIMDAIEATMAKGQESSGE